MRTRDPGDDNQVGRNIAMRRALLKKSIRWCASTAGISDSTWSRIERGVIGTDNRFTLAKIAEALDCDVAALTGATLGPAEGASAAMTGALHAAVTAMLNADPDFPATTAATRPIGELQQSVDLIASRRALCDYLAVCRLISETVPALHAHAVGRDAVAAGQALAMLVLVADAAAFSARYNGDLAAMALIGELSRRIAERLGDPVLEGLAAYTRAHAAFASGLYPRGLLIADRAVGLVAPHADGSVYGGREVMGQLLLTKGFAIYAGGDHAGADTFVRQASVLAAETGDTATLNLHFGPTNIEFWRIAMDTDGDRADKAVARAENTDPTRVVSLSRRTAFHVDYGRALGRIGEVEAATKQLRMAERAAPQRVRPDPLVRETLRSLVEASRRSTWAELRGMCERMGVHY